MVRSEGPDTGGVAALSDEPPRESSLRFGQRVDAIEITHELRRLGRVERVLEPADVDLGQLKAVRHHATSTR